MYTKQYYSLRSLFSWTREETALFIVVALVPAFLYEVFDQEWLHLPWLPIAVVGTAVAFIITFQNNATYDRTWEARKIWGGIVNASRSWGIFIKDYISDQFADAPVGEAELGRLHRELVFRHVAWLTALRHGLRQPRPWERAMDHRTNREWQERIDMREKRFTLEQELEPYLSEEELSYVLSKTNKATQLLALQSKHVRELRERGLIDDFRHVEVGHILVELYTLQGKAERIKNFPYPRQYATLTAAFTWVFVLLVPFGMIHEFDRIGVDLLGDYPIIGDHFVWFSVPFSVLVMWIFHTVGRIGQVTENPFEGTPNDVPITTISRAIEIDLRQMLDEDPKAIPPPIEPQYDTQT